jgi:hypothetical protein
LIVKQLGQVDRKDFWGFGKLNKMPMVT